MPELPEVETVAKSLAPYVVNCMFAGCNLLKESTLHPMSLPLTELEGMRIKSVGRRGKLLLFFLDSPQHAVRYLVFHLRMTGRILTGQANSALGKHTRCVFTLQNPRGEFSRLFFDDSRTFGKMFFATADMLDRWPFWRNLGAEPFSLNSARLAELLTGKRPIKTALLDQSIIAGIGNIYADETLFAAGIHPLRPASSLDQAEVDKLLYSIQTILTDAIAKKGSSIRDYRDADGKQGTFQQFFTVYGKAGKKCKKCAHILEKIRIGGRATVFCPNCQK